MANSSSSLSITTVLAVLASSVPPTGLDKVMTMPSSSSSAASLATNTVTKAVVAVPAKLTVPVGKTPPVPTKSPPLRLSPSLALMAQSTLPLPLATPVRVTMKTTAVEPEPVPSSVAAGVLTR